jgi:NitT/TauT family transport system permease protein
MTMRSEAFTERVATGGQLDLAGRLRSSLTVISLLVGLGLWELVTALGLVDPLFLPRLSTVLADLWKLMATGELWHHLLISGGEFALGMVLAIVVGLIIGMLMGLWPVADDVLGWWINGMNSVPRIALTPLLVVWFGIGLSSKAALVFLGAFFPLALSTATGVRTVNRDLLQMARSFEASPRAQFQDVILPGALPFVLTGLRLAVARGLIGIVVGEMFAARGGVGYLLAQAGDTFNMVRVFSMVIVLAVVGIVLTTLATALERRFEAWRT